MAGSGVSSGIIYLNFLFLFVIRELQHHTKSFSYTWVLWSLVYTFLGILLLIFYCSEYEALSVFMSRCLYLGCVRKGNNLPLVHRVTLVIFFFLLGHSSL